MSTSCYQQILSGQHIYRFKKESASDGKIYTIALNMQIPKKKKMLSLCQCISAVSITNFSDIMNKSCLLFNLVNSLIKYVI